MGNLDRDTTRSGADGRYTIAISEDWRIWGQYLRSRLLERRDGSQFLT